MTDETPSSPRIPAALASLAVAIDDLQPYGTNPRRGNITTIAESLAEHGQYRPIVVRRETSEVLAGNHTLAAARSLGWTEIAATYVDCDAETAAKIVLVDNRSNDLAGYDDQLLAQILTGLEDLAGTGYDQRDLDELLASLSPDPTALTDPDDVPVLEDAPISKPGDVWQLGPHRLVVGDATDPDVIRQALDGAPADMVLTDPPYNVDYTGKTADALKIDNDAMGGAAFGAFLAEAYAAMRANTGKGCPIYVFYATAEEINFRTALVDSGWLYKQTLIWVKQHFVMSRQDYHWQHEPILYGWNPGAPHRWFGGYTPTTLVDEQDLQPEQMSKAQLLAIVQHAYEHTTAIREDRPARSTEHPTAKPVALLARLMENSSRLGDLVLDPFAGSGSTLIAAHGSSRRAALVELDPRYVDVICRRYQAHTGIVPVRDGDPHDFAIEAAA